MKDKKSFNVYSTKLLEIINQMRKYGKDVFEQKVIENILRNWTKKYEHIVVTIKEANDLSKLTVDKLFRFL